MTEQFTNFAAYQLAAPCLATDTTLSLVSLGSLPIIGTFRMTMGAEILLVTAVDTFHSRLTVVRGAENTTAVGLPAGTNIEPILTAGAMAQLRADAGSAGNMTGKTTGSGPGESVELSYSGSVVGALQLTDGTSYALEVMTIVRKAGSFETFQHKDAVVIHQEAGVITIEESFPVYSQGNILFAGGAISFAAGSSPTRLAITYSLPTGLTAVVNVFSTLVSVSTQTV